MSDDFDFEPVRGLPAHLPAGEALLWTGSPSWQVMARRVFRTRFVAIYFAGVAAWAVATAVRDGALSELSWLALLGAPLVTIGLLVAMSWLIARSTVYTLTSRRLVMRFGVALPMTVNVAFKCVAAAGVARHDDGSGDVSLALKPDSRVSYAIMWPHVRPWRVARAEPALRALADVSVVADQLAAALNAQSPGVEAPRANATAVQVPVGRLAASRA